MPEEAHTKDAAQPSELWKNILSETLLITLAGAVLYFWGILYYLQLTESLGLGISLFSISPYEIIVAPWDKAVYVLIWGSLLWLLWHQRHVLEFILYYCILIPALLMRWAARCAIPENSRLRISQQIRNKIRAARDAFPKPMRPPAPLLASLNDPARDRGMFAATFHVLVVGTVIGIGLSMPSRAQERVRKYTESEKKHQVEVQCLDSAIVRGAYVIALGDAVVIDVEESGHSRRVLLKQSQVKRFDKLLVNKAVNANAPADAPTAQPQQP